MSEREGSTRRETVKHSCLVFREGHKKNHEFWLQGLDADHLSGNRDFWFITIPMGFLLFCAVGLMTQTMLILGNFSAELAPVGGFGIVMLGVAVVACIGSWLLGVLDTKFGTKTAIFAIGFVSHVL